MRAATSLTNPANGPLRYERKLLPSGHDLPEVLAWIRFHPAGFREVYPSRWVNNLYLDSPGLTDYHDHVSGTPNRSKSRIRWYGTFQGSIPRPVFERKFRRGALGGKRTFALPPLALNGGLDEHRLRRMLCDVEPDAPVRPCLDLCRPSLVNRYRRGYFQSADGDIRLTVDSELTFFAPEHTSAWMATPPAAEHALVIEIKYSPAQADRAAEVAGRFPWRIARCSKYVLGIEAIRCA